MRFIAHLQSLVPASSRMSLCRGALVLQTGLYLPIKSCIAASHSLGKWGLWILFMVILFIYLAWVKDSPGIGREQEVILTPGHEPLLLEANCM